MTRRQLVLAFALSAVVLAVLNVTLGYIRAVVMEPGELRLIAHEVGASAQARGWPSPSPLHWPPIQEYVDESGFAIRCQMAKSGAEPDEFLMVRYEFGWPLPVLTMLQLWEPPFEPVVDTGLRPAWMGIVLTPMASAGVLVGGLHCVLVGRAGRRRQRGQCQFCAFPITVGSVCPECGSA